MIFNVRAVASHIARFFIVLAFVVTAMAGSLFSPLHSATAVASPLQAVMAQPEADRNAKLDLDAVAGEEASEQVEAKVQKLSSTVQGKVSEAAEEAKVQTAQARNRVEPGLDSVDNTVTQSATAAEPSKSSLIDSVKGFFKG